MNKFTPYDTSEFDINIEAVSKPFVETDDDILLGYDIVNEYKLSDDNYSKLNKNERFIADKVIMDYFIKKNIFSRLHKLVDEKKKYNRKIKSLKTKSKSARIARSDMLKEMKDIIEFNEKILMKYIKRLDLLNDTFNNIVESDTISAEENLRTLDNNSKDFNINLAFDVIEDFFNYAADKCKDNKHIIGFSDKYLDKFLFVDYTGDSIK
ncbi:MAG: hypothetical protein IKE89_02785 [Bacilli bacterium]|nr:hypothetical protein [Bacilli bacterium]